MTPIEYADEARAAMLRPEFLGRRLVLAWARIEPLGRSAFPPGVGYPLSYDRLRSLMTRFGSPAESTQHLTEDQLLEAQDLVLELADAILDWAKTP
ncbi:MAG TPA: hypothetical protein VFA75_19615 [Nevskia sp.]|nr:hypothetical protein [Nevskia sp.]